MYGKHPRSRPGGGGGRGAQPPPVAQAPPFMNPSYLQNPALFANNQFLPNPIFQFQNPSNYQIQAPNFPLRQFPNQGFQPRPPNPNVYLDRIDRAVVKARQDIHNAGESVSAWKVAESALVTLQAESWDSLGMQMQQVPCLHRLILTEGKINAFIHCFVAVRQITSVHELEMAICQNEGLKQFKELKLGPLVRHPLVVHYFSVGSDLTEAFKITSQAIMKYLCEFVDIHEGHEGEEINVEEFLDFIAKKRSVTGRDKLMVRIQSLGMHVAHIQQARKLEDRKNKKFLEGLKQKPQKKNRRPLFSSQKKQLDDCFSSISQRIRTFSSLHEDGGQHIRFVSSSSEADADSEDYAHEVNEKVEDASTRNRVSSCPYPSAAEEMSRLGLKGEMDVNASMAGESLRCNRSNEMSKKKRKSGNSGSNITASRKLQKMEKVGADICSDDETKESIYQNEVNISLANKSMRMFITTWKEACQQYNVDEVFERMLQSYKITARQRKKMKSMFSSFPCIGLLNVALTSIKRGMWDSMYDTLQDFTDQGVAKALPEKCIEYENIEVEPAEKHALITAEHASKHEQTVTVEDIIKQVSIYFELDCNILRNRTSLEKKFTFLSKLCRCECWLTEQFSVKEFESLGCGEFFTFLEKHVRLLPNELQKCLAGESYEKYPLEVCMAQRQLAVLLSQASNKLGENENITKEMISVLLMRQFPSLSFRVLENGLKDFMEVVREHKSASGCALFSATLLGSCSGDATNDKQMRETACQGIEVGHKTRTLGPFTTTDAIKACLKAPMLADLRLWSHWDLVFAPSLGPLVGWLLNEVNTKELLCLVTKDGKVIRVDHAATPDSFLEASLRGSSFQTAVELLSLLSLYGGESQVPLSLLKCYARQAFEVFVNNCVDVDVNENQTFLMQGNSLVRQQKLNEDACRSSSNLCKSASTASKIVTVASMFFMDCLGYFPAEFRPFSADILLSGLRSVIKEAPLAILGECKQIEQRLMLHDVGLSLDIVEWIDDYHAFYSSSALKSFVSAGASCLQGVTSEFHRCSKDIQDAVKQLPSPKGEMLLSVEVNKQIKEGDGVCYALKDAEISGDCFSGDCSQLLSEVDKENEAALVIESIRREEFGLDPRLSDTESSMLKKQHARLGRALHCLSQELYSQDSHFLLELVQNADDNVYQENVEPTLSFILQESGISVLNNEQGFSAQNIRALCDVGNSTKKGYGAGYIGKKGIGFKSVFRVTDAPEIHSNGFHVKFDISEGQIGFVLPTVVPPCDINLLGRLVYCDTDNMNKHRWSTCIVLPFQSKLSGVPAINNIKSMFSDLHPSLLLFLHRLQCIRFRNMLDDSLTIMRKEIVGNGIINVSVGKERMTWFVASQELQAGTIRPDVQTTEISIAFTLQESDTGDYIPRLNQQPVFAFLPLRRYGLKFIIQADFVLPSSREEVDGDSPWNQWLLSKFPDLFVGAERSFCALPCFRDNCGKAVAAFMSFVPLVGEVHGFFSGLPRMIISKLRISKCLLMEGDDKEWVLPCKVIRCWDEQAQSLLPDSLLREHLGLSFLDKSIVLSDSLARDLGIEEYGPKILLQIISSICYSENGLKSVGLAWLSTCLNSLYTMAFHSSRQITLHSGTVSDVIDSLKKIPFIPLSDGTYSSVEKGTIWLHSNASNTGIDNDYGPEAFPLLFAKLRTVSPALLSTAANVDNSCLDVPITSNLISMLQRVGVQQVSAHEIVKVHILPAISDHMITKGDKHLIVEYLSFVMLHLQSSCSLCHVERAIIISELHNKAFILTNYGYKRPAEVLIHFSKELGNPIEINKLIDGLDLKWYEVDDAYLKHPITGSLRGSMMKWREFFQEIGITDFVRVISVEKSVADISHVLLKNMMWDEELMSHGAVAKDWESPELVNLLSLLSVSGDRIRCKYLLEVLDMLWDSCFSDKVTGQCIFNSSGTTRVFRSSFINNLCGVRWMSSIMDNELHYSRDLFYDCEAVRAILGANAPYVVPKVKSEKLLGDIRLKTEVSIADILVVLRAWRRSEPPFMASIAQMSKFYSAIWNEMATSKQTIAEELHQGSYIFVPHSGGSRHEEIVPGSFFSPSEVYWHDLTGSMKQIKEVHPCSGSSVIAPPLCKTLCNLYPSLHDFFVNECGVNETPHLRIYLQILLQLSTYALPSQAANVVFRVFLLWSDGLKSGLLSPEDVGYLKECLRKLECTVLPTMIDKWVSLHPSFGVVCWCDDEKLSKEFKHLDGIDFLYFGELNSDEQEMLRVKVSVLMQNLGIPALSEVITREAICEGMADCSFTASLLNWAVPYAQRYIYNVHGDRYFQLKQSGFENLSTLRIIVVEKLFYRNVIKRSGIASKKQFECSCLLQGNVLYATLESDSHALFMELSRLVFHGTPDLHFANFLHMITTMAESGSNEEQSEFFILNSQKIPKLPDEEPVWSLPSLSSATQNDETLLSGSASTIASDHNLAKPKKKPGVSSNWPPVDWKSAPDFNFARVSGLKTQVVAPLPSSSLHLSEDGFEENIAQTDNVVRININADWTIEGDVAANTPAALPHSEASEDNRNLVASGVDVTYPIDLVTPCDESKLGSSRFGERDRLSFGTPNAQQALITGRLGELVAFNYFVANVGKMNVTWVNENNETGLPYDIFIGDTEQSREYIEVKATKSARKDWFAISLREWQFAVEKGESFSIAHVILFGNNMARVTVFKNPVRLCQLGKLQLAVLMPKQPQEFSVVS